MIDFIKSKEIVLNREDLKNIDINIEDKIIIIGFNEPSFKIYKNQKIDSKLNARFITYFLSAVELAKKQNKRPRFFIISAVNSALRWNCETEEEKKIMMADNYLKIDFLKTFFERFFKEEFSLIEYIIPQDILKIPESKLNDLWKVLENKYSNDLQEVKFHLTRFLYPKKFNTKDYQNLSKEQKEDLKNIDSSKAFKYAISHIFALGDINFEGNYIHNKEGYVSIGGESEKFFNLIREMVFDYFSKNSTKEFFGRDVFVFDNYKIVLKNEIKTPTPYNGMFNKKELLEMTYENNRNLDFYDFQEKLKPQMDYMYENLLPKKEYQKFWDSYRDRYFDLKNRLKEAYDIKLDW